MTTSKKSYYFWDYINKCWKLAEINYSMTLSTYDGYDARKDLKDPNDSYEECFKGKTRRV